MAYCRFGPSSGAYIYDNVYWGLVCEVCSIVPINGSDEFPRFTAGKDRNAMLAHIAEHRAAGGLIPDHVDERLRREIEEEGFDAGR